MSEDLSSLLLSVVPFTIWEMKRALAENDITEIITHAPEIPVRRPSIRQSARVVVLYGEHYRKFWDICTDRTEQNCSRRQNAAND